LDIGMPDFPVRTQRDEERASRARAVILVFCAAAAAAATFGALPGPRFAAAQSADKMEAARTESRRAAAQAQALIGRFNPVRAMAVAYHALPEARGEGWPDLPAVRQALFQAYSASHLIRAYDRKASAAVLSADGNMLAIAVKGGVEIRSVSPDSLLFFLTKTDAPPVDADTTSEISFLDIAPDGHHVLAANANQYWVWSIDNPKAARSASCPDPAGLSEAYFIGKGESLLVRCASGVAVLATADLRPLLTLDGPDATAVSGDGRLIATSTEVRSVADGKVLRTIPKSADAGNPIVAFAPDSRVVAIATGKTITTWGPVGGPVGEIEGQTSAAAPRQAPHRLTMQVQSKADIGWMTFSPDGKMLVTLNDSEIRLWNAATGEIEFVWSGYRSHPSTELHSTDKAYVSHDGRWLLTSSNWVEGMISYDASIWSLTNVNADPIRFIRGGAENRLRAFTDGDKPIFVTVDKVSKRGGVFIWSAEDPLLAFQWTRLNQPTLAFQPEGKSNEVLIESSDDGSLTSCLIETHICKPASRPDPRAALNAVIIGNRKATVSLQGNAIAAVADNGAVLWRRDIGGSAPGERSLALADKGKYVLVKGDTGTIALNTADGKIAQSFDRTLSVTALHGPTVLVAKAPSGFELWNLDTHQHAPLKLPEGQIDRVAASPDGAAAAIVTKLGQIPGVNATADQDDHYALSIISLADHRIESTRELAEAQLSMEFSSDGRRILLGDLVVDAKIGNTLFVLSSAADIPIQSSQYSPDGKLIFSYSDAALDNPSSMRIFLAEDGTLLATLPTTLSALQFSEDGKFFVVQDYYNGVRVYRTPTSDMIAARVRRLLEPAGLLTLV
jgi:WD40 repeat protein